MIKFGVAGNSKSFYEQGNKSTFEAAKWCNNLGIDLFEYSFGRGVSLNDSTATSIGNEFAEHNVEISAHAPYYINFANLNEEMIAKSIMYITKSIEKLRLMQGKRIVFHAASQGKLERAEAVSTTKENLKKLIDVIVENEYDDIILCPETMGKMGQIGTVDEIIDFCNMADFLYPCFDFGHINAREQGSLKTTKDYENIINKMLDNLPSNKVKNMHIHFSKIEYGKGGEVRHLTFEDDVFGPNFEPLAKVLYKNALEPHIICESDGTQAEDALSMKKIYQKLLTK